MQTSLPPVAKGSDLYPECKSYLAFTDKTRQVDDGEIFEAGVCLGYLNGMADGLVRMGITCPNGEATLGTFVRIYVAYVDKHPKVLDIPESGGVVGALREAYPCPAKRTSN